MAFAVILAACSGGRYIEATSTGDKTFREGDYRASLSTLEPVIDERESRGKSAPGPVYSLAGASAYELGEYGKSLEYLLRAREQEYSDERTYLYLARNYQRLDNLSKEISALEDYLSIYPEGPDTGSVRQRLFQTCLESENFDLAEELWDEMDAQSRDSLANRSVPQASSMLLA